MNSSDIAPVIVSVTLILAIAGTILLFPLSRRLGALLEVLTRERREPRAQSAALEQLRDQLDTLNSRLSLLEERQDFQERLLAASHGDAAQLDRRPPNSIQRPVPESSARS